MDRLDKTFFDIIAIAIAGTTVFAFLWEFSASQLTASFFGNNPFLEKQRVVAEAQQWVFIVFALIATFLQIFSTIQLRNNPSACSSRTYWIAFFLGLVVSGSIFHGGTKIAHSFARRTWEPRLKNEMRPLYQALKVLADQDGWQTPVPPTNPTDTELSARHDRMERETENIKNIEDLFDQAPPPNGDFKSRVHALADIFK